MAWLTQKAFLKLYAKGNFYPLGLGEFGKPRSKLAQFRYWACFGQGRRVWQSLASNLRHHLQNEPVPSGKVKLSLPAHTHRDSSRLHFHLHLRFLYQVKMS